MGVTRYPLEVGSIVRKNKTFSITSYMYRANGQEEENPYDVYGRFSRYTFNILDTGDMNGRKVAKVNIKPSDIADIVKRTEYAFKEHMDVENKPNVVATGATVNSPAYAVTFKMGAFKGRTPASLIAEGREEELLKQKSFLAANVGKYPANQQLINAIDDAFQLKANNQLNISTDNENTGSRTINLFTSGLKPQQRKQREDGKCEVNEMRIDWQVGAKYPVTIEITNYYATVVKQADGRLNVREQDAMSRVSLRATASEAEWMDILRKIETNMHMFEILQARTTFAEAEEIYQDQLNAAGVTRNW